MGKSAFKNGRSGRHANNTKYDAHHTVLSKTYGALADLRRELAEPKARIAERELLLQQFATCEDSQRAWLLLEDYFERLSLSRKDFAAYEWWPRVSAAKQTARLEELANVFLKTARSLPTELQSYANLSRFAQLQEAEEEQAVLNQLEHWLFPPTPTHLDSPRASLRLVCSLVPSSKSPPLNLLAVRFSLHRPRTGEKCRTLREITDLTSREQAGE